MLVLMVVALGTYRGRGPTVEVSPGPHVALPLVPPSDTAEPDASASGATPVAPSRSSSTASARPSPSSAGPSAGGPVPTTSPTRSAVPTVTLRASTAPAAPPTVTGQYDVEQRFSGGFIGEVRISNVSGSRQPWTVELDFSGKRIVTAWVLNTGQGTLRRGDDGVYTYRGGVDLAPGASARLQFHVDGSSTTPNRCVVNGTGCGGL
ncbi:cellulose binding domain-containing protein [Micromonospora sp. NPDC049366]|uniref:cellulose binding domain-containing protein n=1 Tax=Micromonospora sp. NPDC049366 TaxID=3364271 RepID=UPI00378CE986